MFGENNKKIVMSNNIGEAIARTEENMFKMYCTGEWTDYVWENGIYQGKSTGHNLIVNNLSVLVAALLKNHFSSSSPYGALAYWSVGDDSTPASVTDNGCVHEIARKAIDSISFMDDSGVITSTPTSRIMVSATFGNLDGLIQPDNQTAMWREFCLVGGAATSNINTGININRKVHTAIEKTVAMTVKREIKFSFTV